MKYKVGDVVKLKDIRYDLITDINETHYTSFCLNINFEPLDSDPNPIWILLFSSFETNDDELITDKAVIDKMNRQYKAYNIQKILSK